MALSDHHRTRLASLLADQSPRDVRSRRCRHLSSAQLGGDATGWPQEGERPLLYHPKAPTGVYPGGALGCGRQKPLAGAHRSATDRGRCRLVQPACVDRMQRHRYETGRVARGTAQDDQPTPSRTALVGDGACHAMGRQRRGSRRGDPTSHQLDRAARNADRTPTGNQTPPTPQPQLHSPGPPAACGRVDPRARARVHAVAPRRLAEKS